MIMLLPKYCLFIIIKVQGGLAIFPDIQNKTKNVMCHLFFENNLKTTRSILIVAVEFFVADLYICFLINENFDSSLN